ncbi:MAG: glycosyltransferase family 39 protein [Candidatus Hydrogenedentes bacterium]|nr:glycosyltransferase family 39 protein [Candidatus Hydrogenedentota bacterium]
MTAAQSVDSREPLEESGGATAHSYGALALVLIALALRIVEYLHNKAIWLDEAHLALNILQRGYAGLTERLDAGQGAPLMFLWAERFTANVLGPGEYSLRLLPLIASLASCVLLYALLRRTLPMRGLLMALAIFALAVPVIRYASEVKAYATDLAVALALYLMVLPLERRPLSPGYAALLAVCGAASVWCAFPATLVLAGLAAVLIVRAVGEKGMRSIAMAAAIAVAWTSSAAANYWLMLRHNTENAEVRTWWLDRFMPLPPTSPSDAYWFVRTYFEVFAEPMGLGAAGLGALLFLFGVYTLWNTNRIRLAFLLAPIVSTLLASGMQVYPFMGRFLLFLVPLILIGIGEGWDFFAANARHRAVVVAAAAVLLVQPAAGALKGAMQGGGDGVRPVFDHVAQHFAEGDKLYVYCWAVPTFHYYELKSGVDYPKVDGQSSRADWPGYVREIAPLRGNSRVWVVLTNTPRQLVGQEDKFILTHLDTIGRRSGERVFAESSVYLYDLRGPSDHGG